MDVLIIGSTEHPLFKCSDILEKVLEYKNPRS